MSESTGVFMTTRAAAILFDLAAFSLYFAVTVSTPVATSQYFLHYLSNEDTIIKAGLYGWCSYIGRAGRINLYSKVPLQCSPRKLGYMIDLKMYPGYNGNFEYAGGGLGRGLVMYPLATVFAFFSTGLMLIRKKPVIQLHALTFISGLLAFIFQMAFFLRIDTQVRETLPINDGGLGFNNWMGLASVGCSLIAFGFSCSGSIKQNRVHGTKMKSVKHDTIYD